MHDIDRTLTEFDMQPESFEYDEFEYPDAEAVFDEATEMELADELLSVGDEAELDQFLGGLLKKAGGVLGRAFRSPIGRALGGSLRSIAKRALPVVGGVLGSGFAPGVGTALGSRAGQAASQIFGLELEGLSPEDQEFETARRFVRFAGEAARQAADISGDTDPRAAALSALRAAARAHAPGLSGPLGDTPSAASAASIVGAGGQSGRWVRRGRKIVLLGL